MDNKNIEEYVRELKRRVRLEDVIEETVALQRHSGRGWTRGEKRGAGEHGLVVNLDKQVYAWNGNSAHGNGVYRDVIHWVEIEQRVDFKGAVEILAKRANMPPLEFGEQDPIKRQAFRIRQSAFEVAQRIFEKWLLSDERAMEYLHDRGILDCTIRLVTYGDPDERGLRKISAHGAGLGFSGRWGDRDLVKPTASVFLDEMRSELSVAGVPLDSPGAVGILGLKQWNKLEGTEAVTAWCNQHEITATSNWINKGRIPGMMGTPGIVFPHIEAGSVNYLSRRNLPPFDVIKHEDGTQDEWKSFNLPNELAGGHKDLYFNQAYTHNAQKVMVVEGQMDAVTWGQYGIAAVAMAGVGWQNEFTLEELKRLAKRHEVLFLGFDADGSGKNAIIGKGDYPIADHIGALGRILEYPEHKWKRPNGNEKTVKDANDLRQYFVDNGIEPDKEQREVEAIFREAWPVVVHAAKAAGRLGKESSDGMEAQSRVFQMLATIENRMAVEQLRDSICDALGVGIRQFKNLLATARKEQVSDDDKPAEIVETLGGFYPTSEDGEKGYLLEMLFDEKTQKARFAYRDSEGHVGIAEYLDVNKKRYIPQVDDVVRDGTVIFPSDLGPLYTTRELVAKIEFYIRRYFLLDNPIEYRLAAYYALFTWVYDCFDALSYFRARGPSGTGKSELIIRLGLVCYRLIVTSGISSMASWKSFCHVYKGSLFLDECDKFAQDEFDERLVILNVGAMKRQAKVANMVEVFNPVTNTRSFKPSSANVYGPKLMTMYKAFKDEATENRCITIDLRKKTMQELEDAGIEGDEIPESMFEDARQLRNMCIRWRLWRWEKRIIAKPENKDKLKDFRVSPRINQVTRPLKVLAQDDEAMLNDIKTFMLASHNEQMEKKSGTLVARVADAIVAVTEDEKYKHLVMEGAVSEFGTVKYIFHKHLAQVANAIMDDMNLLEDASDEDKRKRRGMQPRTIGDIARDDLQFPTHRMGSGFVVVLLPERIRIMKTAWGLDLNKPHQEETAKPVQAPAQEGLFDEPNEPR